MSNVSHTVRVSGDGELTPKALADALKTLFDQGVPEGAELIVKSGLGWTIVAKWEPAEGAVHDVRIKPYPGPRTPEDLGMAKRRDVPEVPGA